MHMCTCATRGVKDTKNFTFVVMAQGLSTFHISHVLATAAAKSSLSHDVDISVSIAPYNPVVVSKVREDGMR